MSRPAQIGFLSRTAAVYDPVVRRLRFPELWERVAELAGPPGALPCLDVCTGTGGLALALARRGAHVLGLDLASGMLARARRKARAGPLPGSARFVRMDARALGVPDRRFPLVTCCMALHEMAEDERGQVVGELARVARERVIVADYRVPSGLRGWWFRASHAFEYLESDDFPGYTALDVGRRLAQAGLRVEPACDAGAYRIWSARVAAP